MKKRLLVFITSLCMIFASAVPALAAETVSSDNDVQKAYEAYLELEKSLYAKPGDYQALKTAYGAFESAVAVVDANDNKGDEWESVIKEKVSTEKFIDVVFDAAFVLSVFEADVNGAPGLFTNYINYGDLKVAYDLVDMYVILEGCGIDMDGMTASIDAVNGNTLLKDAYAAAEQKVAETNKDVFAVYEAYMMMYEALDGEWVDDYPEAIAEFEKVAHLVDGDAANGELSLKDTIDLAILMGETNAEDALKEVNDTYTELKAAAANSGGGNAGGEGETIPEPEDNDGTDKEVEKADKSPDTGDDFNILPFAAIMVLAAVGMGAAVVRKRA